jgi:hypothetical protein
LVGSVRLGWGLGMGMMSREGMRGLLWK